MSESKIDPTPPLQISLYSKKFLYFLPNEPNQEIQFARVFPLVEFPKPLKAVMSIFSILFGETHTNFAKLKSSCHSPIVKGQ